MTDLVIIQTGTANLASVVVAFERIGLSPTVTRNPAAVRDAGRIVLPGVGTFASGVGRLREDGLVDVVRQRIDADRPTLGICLGLQMLGRGSAESPGVVGLGLIAADVEPLSDAEAVPQMGWNRVSSNGGIIEAGWAYFANSFAFGTVDDDWRPAFATHGGAPFVAAVERGAVLACQFHPELSGAWGQELLARWIEETSC